METTDGYTIYKYMELFIIPLYLILTFLFVQIWFLWKNVDKNELVHFLANEAFFKKNCLYVLIFSVSFMFHEILEGTGLPYKMIFFELFEIVALLFIALFAYNWHSALKTCASKRALPIELTNFSDNSSST